jgi:hypothetical protein
MTNFNRNDKEISPYVEMTNFNREISRNKEMTNFNRNDKKRFLLMSK